MPVSLFNGHIIIDDIPAIKLSKTGYRTEDESYGQGVVLHLDYPNCPTGQADLHLHVSCCQYTRENASGEFYRVVLLDEAYNLYFDAIDPNTGKMSRFMTDKPVSASDIYSLAEQTKANYEKRQPVKRGRKISEKIPEDMLDFDYLAPTRKGTPTAFMEY